MNNIWSRRNFLKAITPLALAAALSGIPGCSSENKDKALEEKVSGIPKYIILDSGHGGYTQGTVFNGNQIREMFSNDDAYRTVKKFVGTTFKSACEDEVAYDVLCRVFKKDEEKRVYPIIFDTKTEYEPIDLLGLQLSNQDEYLVYGDEKIRLTDDNQGINERIKIINRYYNALISSGINRDNIYMISIHVDEAPEGRRGAFSMYPPARADYGGSVASAKSKALEERLYEALRIRGVDVVRGYPRDHLGVFSTLPQQKITVEIGNMSDETDYKRVNKKDYRNKIADAILSLTK